MPAIGRGIGSRLLVVFVGPQAQGAEHRDDDDEDRADKQRSDTCSEECLGHSDGAPD